MKRVLVTGANRGIGLELCRQLLGRGDHVFAAVRDPARAEALAALPRGDGRLDVEVLDAADPGSIDRLGARLESATAALDLFIANAGISAGSRDFAERASASQLGRLQGSALSTMFATNSIGPLLLAERLLPLLERSREPRILFVSTQLASLTNKTQGGNYGYGASKAALNMFGRSLANDLRQAGSPIRVPLVHPGWVRTDMGGPQAPTTAVESARGMLAQIERVSPDESGRFIDFRGDPLPW